MSQATEIEFDDEIQMRQNQIVRIGHKIHRPAGLWTSQVHLFLQYLKKKKFIKVPEVFGFDDQEREVLSFLEGNVYHDPLPEVAKSTEALVSAAQLLRAYHDASQEFLKDSAFRQTGWQFPERKPLEVICHGDFAPYNIVFKEDRAVGIIDFDTSHPGPRLWDLAYALYRWAPFMNPDNKDGWGTLNEQLERATLFCKAYGADKGHREHLADTMVERLETLIEFMLAQAEKGDESCQINVREGHHFLYRTDIEYITRHKEEISRRLK